MENVQGHGRLAAVAAFSGAAVMAMLIVSLAGGAPWSPAVVDALSVGTAASSLVVVVIAFTGLTGPWGQVGRALALAGLTLVLAGDAFQAVALRASTDAATLWAISFAIRDGIGNGLFFASLIVLGSLSWSRHRSLAGLAVANGIIGFAEMAFAARLGLPPHFNFVLIIVWFVALGVAWWRGAAVEVRTSRAATPGLAA